MGRESRLRSLRELGKILCHITDFKYIQIWLQTLLCVLEMSLNIAYFFTCMVLILLIYFTLINLHSVLVVLGIFNAVPCAVGLYKLNLSISSVTGNATELIHACQLIRVKSPARKSYLRILLNSLRPPVFQVGSFFVIRNDLVLNTFSGIAVYVMTLLASF